MTMTMNMLKYDEFHASQIFKKLFDNLLLPLCIDLWFLSGLHPKREIDKEEFRRVMALMRSHHRQGAQHRDGLRIGLKVRNSVENGGLLQHFFGKDGKSCLKHEAFVTFLRELQDEVCMPFLTLPFWNMSLL